MTFERRVFNPNGDMPETTSIEIDLDADQEDLGKVAEQFEADANQMCPADGCRRRPESLHDHMISEHGWYAPHLDESEA